MRLLDLYHYPAGYELSYEILRQRPLEHGISHKRMPEPEEHIRFCNTHPFRFWLVIEETFFDDGAHEKQERQHAIGLIDVLHSNEFGVHIFKKYQGRGFGTLAVQQFMHDYTPLPDIPALRNGQWLANVAPANTRAAKFFERLGFKPIQTTYART